MEQQQTLGREKTSSSLPNPLPVTASTTMAAGLEPAPLQPRLKRDTDQRGDISTAPMLEDPTAERSPTAPTNSPVPVIEVSQEGAGVEANESPIGWEKQSEQ